MTLMDLPKPQTGLIKAAAGTVVTTADPPQPDPHDRGRLDLGGFCEGTRVQTADGLRQIEHLQPGDLILTREDGPVALRHIWAIPEDLAPQGMVRWRKSAQSDDKDLYALPAQAVDLHLGLAGQVFPEGNLLVRLGDLMRAGKADLVARHDRQIYRLDLGQPACIFAEGRTCLSLPGSPQSPRLKETTKSQILSPWDAMLAINSMDIAPGKRKRPQSEARPKAQGPGLTPHLVAFPRAEPSATHKAIAPSTPPPIAQDTQAKTPPMYPLAGKVLSKA